MVITKLLSHHRINCVRVFFGLALDNQQHHLSYLTRSERAVVDHGPAIVHHNVAGLHDAIQARKLQVPREMHKFDWGGT